MSMEIGGAPSVLSGGMMLQRDKFAATSKSLPDAVPLSQIGSQAQIDKYGKPNMLPEVPTLRDIQAATSPKNRIDIRV